MVKQKIVLKLALDDERKRRKAFKAAVGMSGVTSAAMEGEKIIIVGDGVDPITLTTVLRRSLGYAELLSVSSGDDKKKDGYGAAYGYGAGEKKEGRLWIRRRRRRELWRQGGCRFQRWRRRRLLSKRGCADHVPRVSAVQRHAVLPGLLLLPCSSCLSASRTGSRLQHYV
uniref:HMA domain-containing protein n=1 Tax=Triticum urartu TaxID=4572 RepID=A0A8R7QDR5_TRIUA